MKLKKLFIKNIRSYKNEEINFPDGSLLLAGDIGSGKTSVLLAIEYALFGLQPGQKGSSLMRNNTTLGSVALKLEIDGKEILIERRLRKNNKSVANEYSAITIDGRKIESSLTEIKMKILEELGYPKEFIKKNNMLYRYTVYTPQEQMKQIILEDPEARLNILRYILGVDKYKRIKENLVIFLNNLKENSKVLQGEIKYLDEEKLKIENKNNFLDLLEKKVKEKENDLELEIKKRKAIESESSELESKIKEKERFEKEIEKTKIMLTNKYEALTAVSSEILELEKALSENANVFNETAYNEIISQIEKKEASIENLKSRYANLLGEINSIENNIKESLEKRKRIFTIEICPTCLQDVPEIHKHNILNETEKLINESKAKTSFLENEALKIMHELNKEKLEKTKLEKTKSSLESLRSRLEYIEKTKVRLSNNIKIKKALEEDISVLNKQIETLKSQIFNFLKFDALYKLKKEEMQKAFESERQAEISCAELKKESELTKKEIVELKEEIKKKETAKKNLSNLLELSNWLSTDFSGLIEFAERNVLLKLRREFSRMFSKWFQMLVPEGALDVRLDESFSPIIMNNETEMEYSFLSGGERTAIALAYRLALNQTINSLLSKIKTKNIVMLDEPTDGFSEIQLDRMRSVFNELNVSQLIIVSHEQKIESFVENILRIKKNGDSSYIEAHLHEPIVLLNQKT